MRLSILILFAIILLICLNDFAVDAKKSKKTTKPSKPPPPPIPEKEIDSNSEPIVKSEKRLKTTKKRGTKDWNSLKISDLEKEWEEDDNQEELEEEFERQQQINQRLKEEEGRKNPEDMVDINDPESLRRFRDNHMNKKKLPKVGQNGAMMFIKLKSKKDDENGEEWTNESVDYEAGRMSALMKTGGIKSTVYNIGKEGGEKQLLASVEKGWDVQSVMKFLLSQKHVEKVTLDSKDYLRTDFLELEDEDDLEL